MKIPLHKENIQGLVVRGYTHPCSCHLLYRFPDKKKAAGFIKDLLPYVQSGVPWVKKPDFMLNMAFTFTGLQIASPLNVDELQNFSDTFKQGPGSDNSQASLNDIGAGSPDKWLFGAFENEAPVPGKQVDVVIHTYGMTDQDLEKIVTIVTASATKNNITELYPFENKGRLIQYPLPNNTIHFGYHDGISEPDLTWPADFPADPDAVTDQGDLNNFLIGYPNSSVQPGPSGGGSASDFSKDGCYNAFRVMFQDVKAFDKYLKDNAPKAAKLLGKSTDYAEEWIAAKLCGRWRNGSPLILSPEMPDPETANATEYNYAGDTKAMKCPFSGHTRVANPRDEPVFPREEPIPRLARRGMPYGAPLNSPDFKKTI